MARERTGSPCLRCRVEEEAAAVDSSRRPSACPWGMRRRKEVGDVDELLGVREEEEQMGRRVGADVGIEEGQKRERERVQVQVQTQVRA